MSYNPNPTRVWSRVQNPCTFTVNSSYDSVFIPLTGKTTSQLVANYQTQLLTKGNVLQYKKNSSSLTKNQRYAQICKGMWTNRTKSYATQTQTYTNPNTSNLAQVNYASVPTNGNTNNIPGPYNFNIPAPYGCTSDTIKDGGSLLCNTVVNPCTNEIVKTTNGDGTLCYPSYCSDVPGPIIDLCWNPKLQTWYPRQRYTMPTSGTKWPEGYKGFVSAVQLKDPIVSVINLNNIIEILWVVENCRWIPIVGFSIYLNGQFYKHVDKYTNSIYVNKSELDENTIVTVEVNGGQYLSSNNLGSSNSPSSTSHSSINYVKTNYVDDLSCSCSFFNKIMNNTAVSNVVTLLASSNEKLLDVNDDTYNLSLEMYNNIKIDLETFQRTLDSECCLTELIDIFQYILTNLYQSSNIKKLYLAEKITAESFRESHDILKDHDKLQKYLDDLKKNILITNVDVVAQLMKLKPQFDIYIQLYGTPDNLNFNPFNLKNIIDAIAEYNTLYPDTEPTLAEIKPLLKI